jgi:sialate O-acetylesterase
MMRRLLAVSILSLALYNIVHAKPADALQQFKAAGILQSNMVIQQNKPFKLWGFGPAGDKITINADWQYKPITTTINAQGNWLAKIKVPSAVPGDFRAHQIYIIHNNDTIKLNNLLIGEVWICTGQSNMELRIKPVPGWSKGMLNGDQEAAIANYRAIRLCKVDMGLEFSPVADCHATWQVCSPKSAGDFSAVAYFFGRELFYRLNVPIGLIDAAIPATACQAFTNRVVLDADTTLRKHFVDPYITGIADIEAKNNKSTTLTTLLYPGLVYNKMIYPLKNLSVAGFTWYQGESNKDDTLLYARLCTAMLIGWRHDFAQGRLPFYYVQVAPYSWNKTDSTADDYAKFREEQGRMLKVRNTGMAITMDVGEPNNIHPFNKKPVGIRLAKIALVKTYHITDVAYQGPRFEKFKVTGDTVLVAFKASSLGTGLTTNDGGAPKYFYLAGADHKFYRANARIIKNRVLLYTPDVKKPIAVRYAFTNYPVTNLENAEGLPAEPFRTDKW